MKLKWITVVVIVFGLLAMFYVFNWSAVLKTTLIVSCVVLVGCVLLQSGKGGGLAAIGGLADQSAIGVQTGGILVKVTYLVGAIFIVSTLMLTKLTLSAIHGTDTLRREMSTSIQHDQNDHAGHDHDDHAGHDHPQDTEGGGGTSTGMKAVDTAGEGQTGEANKFKSTAEEK